MKRFGVSTKMLRRFESNAEAFFYDPIEEINRKIQYD